MNLSSLSSATLYHETLPGPVTHSEQIVSQGSLSVLGSASQEARTVNSKIWRFCFRLLILVVPMTVLLMKQSHGKDPDGKAPPKALVKNWWSVSDADFASQCANLATGTQIQQSQFAWMAFARANQQVDSVVNRRKFSRWELWPNDPDTFTPDAPPFQGEKKMRTRPHLQPLQQLRMRLRHEPNLVLEGDPFPQSGQEVARNLISYNYIIANKLNTIQGIEAYFSHNGARIEFPIGAVEAKAYWSRGLLDGAYQLGGLSLTALHLMVKIKATPGNPFTDDGVSWFWTTFELKSNQGLQAAEKFITYHDTLTLPQVQGILQQAGLNKMPFINYVCNGHQIQFKDPKHQDIILGNTKIEWLFATPANHNPNTWTKWSTSCHSCHAQASGMSQNGIFKVFQFTAPVGSLKGIDLPGGDYQPFDFVWALGLAQ